MILQVLTLGLDKDNDTIEVWCTGNFSKHWIAAGWRDSDDEELVHLILNGIQLVVKETPELTAVLKDL